MAKENCKHDSDLYQSALYLFVTFDPHFLKVANDMARDLEVRTSFIIERLALAHLAELAADEELAGGTIPKLMPEFCPGQTATQFYDNWKDNKVRQARADEDLAKHMKERNKYLLPDELPGADGYRPVRTEELKRRQGDSEIAKLPLSDAQKRKITEARIEQEGMDR